MSETIFIASNSHDIHVKPVAEELQRQGIEPICYDADRVAFGEIALHIGLGNEVTINYDDTPLEPQAFDAAWSRRPRSFGPFYNTEDRGTRICLDREWAASQQLLFDLVPEERWLNSPERMRYAGHKLTQLMLAKAVGFEIPTTITSNNWETISAGLQEGDIIFKPFYGELYEGSEVKVVYSNMLTNQHGTPPREGLPYPGIWQDYKQKGREWRLTIVGDDSFDVAVYTDSEAKDDWRRHQQSEQVVFRQDTFPAGEKEKCFKLLRRLGLRFGTFDLIEQPGGEIIYLEMNPNGQYIWLEQNLGLPISKAVATELVRIARG